jgi:hypothetical protein
VGRSEGKDVSDIERRKLKRSWISELKPQSKETKDYLKRVQGEDTQTINGVIQRETEPVEEIVEGLGVEEE